MHQSGKSSWDEKDRRCHTAWVLTCETWNQWNLGKLCLQPAVARPQAKVSGQRGNLQFGVGSACKRCCQSLLGKVGFGIRWHASLGQSADIRHNKTVPVRPQSAACVRVLPKMQKGVGRQDKVVLVCSSGVAQWQPGHWDSAMLLVVQISWAVQLCMLLLLP